MLISSTMLKNAIVKSRKHHNDDDKLSPAVTGYFIFILTIFFILELIVLFYSIKIAVKTTKIGPERTVNIILACMLSFPYMMFNILLNPAAREVLGSKRC